ncbi:MAG: hypothetical protein ACI9TY_000039 [Alphaproteobacteria bacterium]|jgi:hypothetical protein
MLRTVIITLLNIALPFLIRAIYIYILRIQAKKQQKKGVVDITPPAWHFPVKKLILAGLALSLLSIVVLRFTTTDIDDPYEGNVTISESL